MIGTILQMPRVVIDPLVWKVLQIISGDCSRHLVRYISSAYTLPLELAKNRHRDPLGWGAFIILFLATTYLDNPAYCRRRHILSSYIQTNACFYNAFNSTPPNNRRH